MPDPAEARPPSQRSRVTPALTYHQRRGHLKTVYQPSLGASPRRAQLVQGTSIDRSIDDDDESRTADTLNNSSSSTSIDPAMPARDSLLVAWLTRQGVGGAAGLVAQYGTRAVLNVVWDMVEYSSYYGRLQLSRRFNNSGGFLNWSLRRGGYRRPAWQKKR